LAQGSLIGISGGILQAIWRRRCSQILGFGGESDLFCGLGLGLGLALGAVIGVWASKRFKSGPILIAGSFWTLVFTVIGQRLTPLASAALAGAAALRSSESANIILCAVVAGVVTAAPSMGLGGMVLALARKAGLVIGREPGLPISWSPLRRFSGAGIAFSVAGFAIAGSGLARHYLLESLGGIGTLAAGMASLACAAVFEPCRRNGFSRGAVVAAGGALMAALGNRPGAVSKWHYVYGQESGLSAPRAELFFKSGASSDFEVVVIADEAVLLVDGIPLAGRGPLAVGEKALGLIPNMLRPDATNELVAGLGTGIACSDCLLWPGRKVCCVDPDPGMLEATRCFNLESRSLLANPRCEIHFDDARHFLRKTGRKFDLVMVNGVDARIPSTTGYVTREFMGRAKNALSQDGLLAIRVNIESLVPEELAQIARSQKSTFAHSCLARLPGGQALLLGSSAAIIRSPEEVAAAAKVVEARPELAREMKGALLQSNVPAALFRYLWLGDDGMARLGARDSETSMCTDWNPVGSWQGSRISRDVPANAARMDSFLNSAGSLAWLARSFAVLGCSNDTAKVCHDLTGLMVGPLHRKAASAICQWALSKAADSPDLLADQFLLSRDDAPKGLNRLLEKISANSASGTIQLGSELSRLNRGQSACAVFQALTEKHPNSARAWLLLSRASAAAGNEVGAKKSRERANALDPLLGTGEQ
jgi:SAM-dependent methyltransferase